MLFFGSPNASLLGVGPVMPAGNATLHADLGGNSVVLAHYDSRNNVTESGGVASAWGDTRGAGFGPDLTASGTERPAYASELLTFDNVDDYMATAASPLLDASPALSLIVIGASKLGDGAEQEYVATITESLSTVRLVSIRQNASDTLDAVFGPSSGFTVVNINDDVPAALAASTNRRLLMVSKSATTALETRVADSPVTGGTASASQAAGDNVLTVGRLFAGAAQWSAIDLRVVMVLNRAFTVSDYNTIRTYASTYHSTVET